MAYQRYQILFKYFVLTTKKLTLQMKRLGVNVNYNKRTLLILSLTGVFVILMATNASDYYLKFRFKVNSTSITYCLASTILRGILLSSLTIFTFYNISIYTRYNSLNECFR